MAIARSSTLGVVLKADASLGHLTARKVAERAAAFASEDVGDIQKILVVEMGDRAFYISKHLHSTRVSSGKPLHSEFQHKSWLAEPARNADS